MKNRASKNTIAVIGEGLTEKYYLKSLEGLIKAQVKPLLPNHSTNMNELRNRIEDCIDEGYNYIFCLIDMDNKKEGKNQTNYLKLKQKFHDKTHSKRKQGTESYVRFFENERCLEIWFLYHFKYTTQPYHDSGKLTKELNKICGYEKTEDFFARKSKGLHHFLLNNGGILGNALENARKSTVSKEKDGRNFTYSEMADFFSYVLK